MEEPWENSFSWKKDLFYGFCDTVDEANSLVKLFSYQTSTSYVVARCSRNFGHFELGGSVTHCVRFSDDNKVQHGSPIDLDGVPFMIVGSKLMECHQGPHRRKSKETQKKQKQGTKKQGCKASVYMREVLVFPEYRTVASSDYNRRQASERLRCDLEGTNAEAVCVVKRIYIDLPQPKDHQNHVMGDAADLKMAIDDRVLRHVNELVDCGVTSVAEMQRHVAIFVKTLFSDSSLPKATNRRFYPSRSDLTHLMYRRRKANSRGMNDLDVVRLKINEWSTKHPTDVWLCRQSSGGADESHVTQHGLLILHQTAWQRRLLHLYGQDIVYLDAPFKNVRHAQALHLLYVCSNNGPIVVGAVITENADCASLTEALEVLKSSNPDWMPRGFMVDASDLQISAVLNVFPSRNASLTDSLL